MSGAPTGRRPAAEPINGGRRSRVAEFGGAEQPGWPTAADERGEIDLGLPRRRRRVAEQSHEQSEPGAISGRRALPQPEPQRPAAGRRTYRDETSGDGRGWQIPDEPWRGTEVPWRGPDGEYHTGQMSAITDEDLAAADAGGRPDLILIAGKEAEVREYDSNYEGRDVAPLPPGPDEAGSRHLRAVPGGEYYGRGAR